MAINNRLNILFTANKALPDNDHRLVYGQTSQVCSMTYAFPDKPETLDRDAYIKVNLGEGLRLKYVYHLFNLTIKVLKRRKEFNVWHHSSTLPILIGPILSRLIGMPSVVTITGFGRIFTNETRMSRALRLIYMLLLGISIRLCHRVLFQNHGDLAHLTQKFPTSSRKFRYVGSAVKMPIIRQKDFTTPKLRVLLAARLMPDKGIEDFFRTAEALGNTEFDFVLAGPPSMGFDELFERTKDCHARGIIQYVGELTHRDMLEQLMHAHVFYLPSTYGEGMARVMLEAGFAQVCPIAYDISANRDLIDDGRGFLLKPGDTDAVVSILRRLAADREFLQTNAINYQQHICQNYSIRAFCLRLDGIFKQLGEELDAHTDWGALRLLRRSK